MDESSVKGAMGQFSRYLSSPDSHTLPQLQMLHSSSLKEVVCARAAALVSTAYAEVYDAVHRHGNRYGEAVTAATMQPTPQQVQALLM
ncbi:conserved oligomeric Golgi complex subunit 6 [Lampetra planeri]